MRPARSTLVHLDLYRLRDPGELEHLGLREWARPGCLWLVEWPERAGGLLPPADLTVHLAAGADAHRGGRHRGKRRRRRLAGAHPK